LLDGGQDGGLGFTAWHPLGAEAEAKQPDQYEEEAHDAEQELHAALKLQNSGAECLLVLAEQLRRDYRPRPATYPARGRGAGDAQLGEQSWVPRLADEVADAMVIRPVEGSIRHRRRVPALWLRGKPARVGRRQPEFSTMSRLSHLRQGNC
jgi:hypothetical protein